MKCDIRVLCRAGVASGFRLAGMPVTEITDVGELPDAMGRVLDQPEVGVVLVEEGLHEAMPESIRRRLARVSLPMLVPFPGPAWEARPQAAESYIVELLRQVIGYRVRLR